MNEEYTKQHELSKKRLNTVRSINKLRRYVYTLSRDERHYFFTEVETYLKNTLQKNRLNISESERTAITNILAHWNIASVEANSTNWWSTLLYNHGHCETFIHMIKTCVEEEVDETSKDVSDTNSVATLNNLT